jgi:hypothetical protein
MIALLFSPIGRYALIAFVAASLLVGTYWKIRSDAVAQVEAEATADALRRTQDALRAGDNLRLSGDGLRNPDRNSRD